jgi:hypothetical protein
MSISKAKIADEQRKEAEYNKLFEAVIAKSPFGKWYPLMKMASNTLRKNLPKQVGIDEDGRPVVIYKDIGGKLLGVWSTSTHEVIAKDLSEHKYGKALGALFGIGQIQEMKTQMKAKIFDISPDEVTQVYNKKLQAQANNTIPKSTLTDDNLLVDTNYSTNTTKNNSQDNTKINKILDKTPVNYNFIGTMIFLTGCFIAYKIVK